jgi:hypothetical protein
MGVDCRGSIMLPSPNPSRLLGVGIRVNRGDVPVEKGQAHYLLSEIQARFCEADGYLITGRVRKHMALAGWDEADVQTCVAFLEDGDFYKSQAHSSRPGVWLDIYKPIYDGETLYVKFTEHEDGRTVVLLSYCVDGDEH